MEPPKCTPSARVKGQICRGANQEVGTPNGSKIIISMEPPPKVRQRGGSSGRVRGGVEIGKMMKVGDFIIRRRLDQCHSMFSLNCQMAPGASIVRHKVALGILSHADKGRHNKKQANTSRHMQTQADTGRHM